MVNNGLVVRDGEWSVPGPEELRHGRYVGVAMQRVPGWLDNIDALVTAMAGVMMVVVALAGPYSDAPGAAEAGVILAVLGLASCVFSLRYAMTGLAVNNQGVRIRRMWTTVVYSWPDIASFEMVAAPHVYTDWNALRISPTRGQPTWVLKIRSPRKGKGSPFVDRLTKASYRSVGALVVALDQLRSAYSA